MQALTMVCAAFHDSLVAVRLSKPVSLHLKHVVYSNACFAYVVGQRTWPAVADYQTKFCPKKSQWPIRAHWLPVDWSACVYYKVLYVITCCQESCIFTTISVRLSIYSIFISDNVVLLKEINALSCYGNTSTLINR
jgi:hypothetical protein